MANAKGIRSQINSIQNTRKITKAMEMVAASKKRRAQERMSASRPYANRLKEVIAHLATGRLEYQHPYLLERKPKRVGLMVISTDRGLCGGLNANLFKSVVQMMQSWDQEGIEIDVCAIGKKAEAFFKRWGGNVVASVSGLGDKPSVHDVIGPVKVMLDAYDEGKIDRFYVVYSEFVNTMVQKPRVDLLLPIVPEPFAAITMPKSTVKHHHEYSWDYIYEPNAKALLDALILRYLESCVYQGLVENGASEQAARMIAMKSASDNATDLMNDLRLMYNKARQASITQELSEIVSGAAAV
jgi:F-type H+-transporting ATPase subunit gamma